VRFRIAAVAGAALALASPALAGPPRVEAEAWIVQNAATGEVLGRSDAAERLPMASLTKLMTVRVALKRARLGETVAVPAASTGLGGSSIFLRAGERLTVEDLARAALIQSANDAAEALAGESSARFVAAMNAEAARLGLRDTHFANPHGLDAPGHYSSARDVLKLARVVMRNPTLRAIVRRRSDTIAGGRSLHTWNDLLGRVRGVIGVKTGHTAAAGWCQVAALRRPGMTIYAVILGSPTRARRNADLAALLEWGASQYRLAPLLREGQTLAHANVGYGLEPVPLVVGRELRGVVRLGRPLVREVVAPGTVELPVAQGERLGSVRVYAGRRLVGERPLLAGRTVERPGVLGRAGWYTRRTLGNLWELATP
jgi:serine-type D-Ala-D-Ala carboxypeptidase (penicillin-binding protein 5/6)